MLEVLCLMLFLLLNHRCTDTGEVEHTPGMEFWGNFENLPEESRVFGKWALIRDLLFDAMYSIKY